MVQNLTKMEFVMRIFADFSLNPCSPFSFLMGSELQNENGSDALAEGYKDTVLAIEFLKVRQHHPRMSDMLNIVNYPDS